MAGVLANGRDIGVIKQKVLPFSVRDARQTGLDQSPNLPTGLDRRPTCTHDPCELIWRTWWPASAAG